MSYKSILVHLDTSDRARARLETALTLARQFGAYLSAVFAVYTPEPTSFYVMAGTADYFADQQRRRDEKRAALERLFHAELKRADVEGQWIVADARANEAVPHYARYADLVIAGQTDPDDPETYVDDSFPDTLVLSAGRPVLLLPYAGMPSAIGTRVLVAWDGSREATRAVHDAAPFLALATKTTIVTVNGAAHEPPGARIPGADIALTLARHHANIDVRGLERARDASIGDVLLSHAYESGTDLLVMGAYGHARWRELILGGVTRTIFASMTVPVLMSH
ncbi:universal stress protein [Burkholderia pseudomallei]|uniref:universal stress protein n=1 Tax=Burkholderia pseudomallei TaxID=28450 RepID=UPI001AAFE3F5|nr:universal stress protein [Burkholderia pseudomallei]MBO2982505.1 universal stress protein [Burkholderia pseudomallei]MBO7914736.1 universal stress protein [Burkholderia pseudomallei]